MTVSTIEKVKASLSLFPGEQISLLVGEPFYPPLGDLSASLSQAAREGCHRYSDPHGNLALKERICRVEAQRGLAVTPENVVIGNGSKGLLFGLISLLGKRGVMVPTPAYPAMLLQPKLLGLELISFSTAPPAFRLDVATLQDLSRKGSCLIIGSPANPTGIAYGWEERKALVAWCKSRGAHLISDEVYSDLSFNGDSSGFGSVEEEISTVVVVRSFSKSHGICGWRLGYVLCSAPLAERLTAWYTVALSPPSNLVQRGIELGWPNSTEEMEEHRRYYAETAVMMAKILQDGGMRVVPPQGGFYLFADVSGFIKKGSLSSSAEFCSLLASRHGLAFWPGEDFGQEGWIRISFGAIDPENREALLEEIRRRLHAFTSGV